MLREILAQQSNAVEQGNIRSAIARIASLSVPAVCILVFCFIPTAVSQREFYEGLLQRIQSTPGVQEAATTTMLPASDQGLHDPFTVGLARGYDGPNVVEP